MLLYYMLFGVCMYVSSVSCIVPTGLTWCSRPLVLSTTQLGNKSDSTERSARSSLKRRWSRLKWEWLWRENIISRGKLARELIALLSVVPDLRRHIIFLIGTRKMLSAVSKMGLPTSKPTSQTAQHLIRVGSTTNGWLQSASTLELLWTDGR